MHACAYIIISLGVGTPLSSKELRQMLEDEKLKRSSLEDGEWDQLPPEQRREVRCVCVCVCVCALRVCVCALAYTIAY
jgi:hypothetical protein